MWRRRRGISKRSAGRAIGFCLGDALEVPPPLTTGPLVGRQGEVEAVAQWFERAAHGARQLVFLSGEAGIGKTTVVDMVLARLGTGSGVRIARGQCAEHYGEGEPYLPLLEALGQLCRGPRHPDVLAVLRRYAPLWLVQLLGVLSEAELEHLQRHVQGATAARMLRELAEALDVLTADVPLVLVLEDLQWSDHATVEALAYLAQRRGPRAAVGAGDLSAGGGGASGRIPCAASSRSCVGGGRRWKCGWNSSPPRR